MQTDKILILIFAIIVGLRELYNHFRVSKLERKLDEANRERTNAATQKTDSAGRAFYDAYRKYTGDGGDKGGSA